MKRLSKENPFVTSRPLEVVFRYVGPLFDTTSASGTMAAEVMTASSYLSEAVGRYVTQERGHIHPRISRVTSGSWEVILQFAMQTVDSVASIGNLPHISALANIGGCSALILGAVKICAKRAKDTPIEKNSDGTLSLVAGDEKIEVPKASLELALDPKFRLGLEALIAFQLLRPGIDAVDVRIGNEYVTVTGDDVTRIIEKYPDISDSYTPSAPKVRGSEKPSIIRVTEERVLRFETPSQRGRLLIFTDCYREPKPYQLGPVASRQIKKEFGGKLYKGRFYNCLVENGVHQYQVERRYLTIDALQFIGPDIPKSSTDVYLVDDDRLRLPAGRNEASVTNRISLTTDEKKRREEARQKALSNNRSNNGEA